MKTLVFCTSYAASGKAWENRQAIWIRALQASRLRFDQLLIVDDGSPVLPEWPDVEIVREATAPSPQDVRSDAQVLLYAHETRLGRQSVFEFPGWYRSFAFGVLYGAAHGFEKIIHIESDAFLISERIQRYFDAFSSGWFALWCGAYQFPEIAIQAAAGDAIKDMVEFVSRPYSQLEGQIHEFLFPFTHINRMFVGNRYGESIGHVPHHADFSAQTHGGQSDSYYWWIPSEPPLLDHDRGRAGVKCVDLYAPFSYDQLAGSWSTAEADYHWMVDLDSVLHIPAVADGEYALSIDIFPCILDERKQQTLYLIFNDRLLDYMQVLKPTRIDCRIPSGLTSAGLTNQLRFIHPDGFSPNAVSGHPEVRRLSIALCRCTMTSVPSQPNTGAVPCHS